MASRLRDDAAAPAAAERVELGRIGGPFGVRGWVKVSSYTRPREGIFEYRHWHLGDGAREDPYEFVEGRAHGTGLIARLAGCGDRNSAEALAGSTIWVPRESLADSAADEYYWRDLIGLAVVNTGGENLGRVRELMETGANDVLVLAGERERLVPFTRQVIREVDLDEGRMVVDWEGDF